MRAHRTWAVVLRQFYLVRGTPSRWLPMSVWVAIDVVLWGFITKYLSTITTAGLALVPLLLGAIVLWDFLVRVMHGVTTAFFEDVWSRNFLNVFASPITVGEYLAGLVFSGIVTSAVGLVVMLVLAGAAFGLSFLAFGAALVPFLAVLLLFGVALGIAGSAVVLRFGPASEWFIWPVPALISPFAGVFYPVSTLPPWMQLVSRALPPSYVFEGMRTVVAGGSVRMGSLAVGALLAVVSVLLASRFFARVHRHAVRTGLIARYSAESVS